MSHITHDVLLGEAIQIARQIGFRVCFDHLDGVGNEPVQVAGERWIVLDRQQPSSESLSRLVRMLQACTGSLPPMSDALQREFGMVAQRRAA